MDSNIIKDELQLIISGKGKVGQDTLIQAVAHYLRGGTPPSSLAEVEKRD